MQTSSGSGTISTHGGVSTWPPHVQEDGMTNATPIAQSDRPHTISSGKSDCKFSSSLVEFIAFV